MKFIAEIDLGNDEMRSLRDVADALTDSINAFGAGHCGTRELLDEPNHRGNPPHDGAELTRSIQDGNGNTVGRWRIEP